MLLPKTASKCPIYHPYRTISSWQLLNKSTREILIRSHTPDIRRFKDVRREIMPPRWRTVSRMWDCRVRFLGSLYFFLFIFHACISFFGVLLWLVMQLPALALVTQNYAFTVSWAKCYLQFAVQPRYSAQQWYQTKTSSKSSHLTNSNQWSIFINEPLKPFNSFSIQLCSNCLAYNSCLTLRKYLSLLHQHRQFPDSLCFSVYNFHVCNHLTELWVWVRPILTVSGMVTEKYLHNDIIIITFAFCKFQRL